MDSKTEQRVVIQFLIDADEKPAKIFLKLKKVFRNECASRARVFKWARRFKAGRKSVYNDEQPAVPVTVTTNVNVNRLSALFTTDLHLKTRMLLVELGINHETVLAPCIHFNET